MGVQKNVEVDYWCSWSTVDQNYFGAAISNNKNSLHKTKNTIWTINYHCILYENEPLSQQNYLCPKGSASWRRYQLDEVKKTRTYSQDIFLLPVLRNELKPHFSTLKMS